MKFLFNIYLLPSFSQNIKIASMVARIVIATTVSLCLLITLPCSAKPIMGDWEHKVQNKARTDFAQVRFYAERYQSVKGGLTIVFPEKYFTKIPLVYVTIGMLNNPNSTPLLAHAIVEECSTARAVIRVNKELPGFFFNDIIEAEDGEFFVNVFVVGD